MQRYKLIHYFQGKRKYYRGTKWIREKWVSGELKIHEGHESPFSINAAFQVVINTATASLPLLLFNPLSHDVNSGGCNRQWIPLYQHRWSRNHSDQKFRYTIGCTSVFLVIRIEK